jgi:hypothetical protein
MKTKKITITIELPMDSEQANNWVDKKDFVDATVNEIFNEEIKYKLVDYSGQFETDDEKGNFKIEIVDFENES